jgi:hypothetical protein
MPREKGWQSITETDNNDTTAAIVERVYLPAVQWDGLLRALQHASKTPCDQAAALRGVVDFLDAVPAVREAGITHPLHQLLAALPYLLRLASRFNELLAELAEACGGPNVTILEKGGTQLGMLLRFVEDATDGRIGPDALKPVLALFVAVHDRVHHNKPSLLFDASWPTDIKTKPLIRYNDIARGYLAAAADVLHASGMKPAEVVTWWGNPSEAAAALRDRKSLGSKKPPPFLVVQTFRELRPRLRQPIKRAAAEQLARQWIGMAGIRRADPHPE